MGVDVGREQSLERLMNALAASKLANRSLRTAAENNNNPPTILEIKRYL